MLSQIAESLQTRLNENTRQIMEILESIYTGRPRQLYQPIEVFAFRSGWTIVRDDTLERAEALYRHAKTTGMIDTALDIGCNTGFLCRFLYYHGVSHVVGMERESRLINVCRLMNTRLQLFSHELEPLPTYVTGSDVYRVLAHPDLPERYDIITCLSVFHRLVTTDHTLSQREGVLDMYAACLDHCRVLYVDLVGPDETDLYDRTPEEWRSPAHFAGMMARIGAKTVDQLVVDGSNRPLFAVQK